MKVEDGKSWFIRPKATESEVGVITEEDYYLLYGVLNKATANGWLPYERDIIKYVSSSDEGLHIAHLTRTERRLLEVSVAVRSTDIGTATVRISMQIKNSAGEYIARCTLQLDYVCVNVIELDAVQLDFVNREGEEDVFETNQYTEKVLNEQFDSLMLLANWLTDLKKNYETYDEFRATTELILRIKRS